MVRSLLWLCASTLLTIAGFAGALPAAATVMEKQGFSAGVIGIITSLVYAGVLCMAPFQPRLARRFGAVAAYQMGKMFSALGFAGLALAHTAWMWALATFFIGLGAGLTWPVTDSLVASFAPEGKKGAWMGLFQTGMGAAWSLGPFLASALEKNPNATFIGASVATVISSLPLIGRRADVKRDAGKGLDSLWAVLKLAPELAVLAFMGGFFEYGTHTAVTLSALALSWKGAGAISLTGVIGAGAFVAQYPVGKLADVNGPRRIIAIIFGVMIVSCLPLAACRAFPFLLWVIAFIWGAVGGCIYTLAMTGMAQRFSSTRVVAATTVMVMSYTVGGIFGPAVAGYAVEWSPLWGPTALFIVASLLGIWRTNAEATTSPAVPSESAQ